MEGMNGFQFAAQVRQLPSYKSVPIIFATSLGQFSQFFQSADAGGGDVIAKPYLLSELSMKVIINLCNV